MAVGINLGSHFRGNPGRLAMLQHQEERAAALFGFMYALRETIAALCSPMSSVRSKPDYGASRFEWVSSDLRCGMRKGENGHWDYGSLLLWISRLPRRNTPLQK